MQYKTFSTKWGDPTFGTESGEIEWSMDLLGGLKIRSGYDVDDLEQATRAAFDRWEEVANIDFTEVNSGADLTISTGVLAGGTVGQARWGGFPSTRWGEITMDEEPRWAPYGQGGTDWYAVMLHEIGHIMGLDHFNDVNQIMNPFVAADFSISSVSTCFKFWLGACSLAQPDVRTLN
ncbi:MAG: matrixin family metalloprotease [Pseudomonadota bacterium]